MKEETKILERSHLLFLKLGIRSVTMDDVAREAGISKRTLYQYFADKDDLITQVIDYDLKISSDLLSKGTGSEIDALDELFFLNSLIHKQRLRYSPTYYNDLKRYYPDAYQSWITSKRARMYELITGNLRKGKKEGVYRSEVNENIIGRLHMARMEMMEMTDLMDELEVLSGEFIEEVFTYHLHGICNEKGIKRISTEKSRRENQKEIIK